jgi:hypothetical protein
MAINSAQGIASLYRGNPQPLQQSIQKDQQAKPGLPPDLQKMLALQIVTNEKDAAAAQTAMQQLKQMSEPTGQMPTVMESLQQQAQQKMQAMGQQARQQAEQRGLPAGLMGVQGEPPQPEAQPEAQGIDQSDRVAFAGAEGGIVAFQSRGEVPESEPASDSMGGFTADPEREALNALRNEEKYAEENRIKKIEELRRKAEFLERAGAPQADAVRAQLELEERKAPESRSAPVKPEKGLPSAAQQAPAARPVEKMVAQPAPEKVVQRQPTQQRTSNVSDIAALAKQMQASQPTAAPAVDSPAMQMIKTSMNLDPEVEEAKTVAKRKAALPQEDLSQYDRLIAELEKRKQGLEPKKGYEGLMEFLGQVSANSQPGRGSFASGAAGSRALDAMNRERATQQFELSKQAIDVSQKKLDANRKYAEDNYNVGRAKFDEVYKGKLAAAKEVVANEAEATKIAKQETLKYFELAQNQMLEREKMRAQAAGRPFDLQGAYAKAMLAGDKKTAAILLEAMKATGEAKKPGADTAQVAKFREDKVRDFVKIEGLKNKQNKGKISPEEQVLLQRLEGEMARTATAQGIDPAQLGIGGAPSSSNLDLSKWGEPKKN